MMALLKKSAPVTPGVRHKLMRTDVVAGEQSVPKGLSVGKPHKGGRNHSGHITCRHRGGGHKSVLRQVSVLRPFECGKIVGIQWDPNRFAPIALVACRVYSDGLVSSQGTQGTQGTQEVSSSTLLMDPSDFFESLNPEPTFRRYIIAGEGMAVGGVVGCMVKPLEVFPNYRTMRSEIGIGSSIYDVSLSDGIKSNWVKTPGSHAVVIRQEPSLKLTMIRMPSGEVRWMPQETMATVGSVSCKDHMLEVLGKAGVNRHRGIRPTVRGCAMNPIDHPHGGRTKGGRHDVTPWAKIAKGQPTRPKRKALGLIIKTSRQVRMGAGVTQ